MAVLFQERITRRDARSRPDVLFVFGDNEARRGSGGQAEVLRGEPNAVGVATKRYPSTDELAYWNEREHVRCCKIVDQDLKRVFVHVRRGGTVVFPRAGIGTGRAQLPTRAPTVMEHIRRRVRELVRLSRQAAAREGSET